MEATMTMAKKPSLIKSKFKAAGIHLGISSIIFLILAYFIIFKWYPFPYFTALTNAYRAGSCTKFDG